MTLSTAESEYIAATEAVKEGIWIQGLLKELHLFQGTATLSLIVKVQSICAKFHCITTMKAR